MVSILTVPEQKPSATVTVALTPDDTREWLEKLSHDESEESLTRIHHELYDLNRIPVKPGARLRLLEPYRASVKYIADNIEAGLAAQDIPFQKSQTLPAEICRRAMIEMAYGYKCVVLDLAKLIRSSRANKDLRTAIHRAISYLSQSAFRSALYYNSPPPGTWIEIHSLFAYARKLGMEASPVKDALNKSRRKNTITHAYQQAILFGVSDVYRFSAPVTGKLYRYLERWASAASTKDYVSAPDNRCQFVVDPELDRPAQPLDQKSAPKRTRSMLQIDARAITNVAHSQWHGIRKGDKPKANGLGEAFFDGNGFDMLEQVIRAWGIAPRRKFPRNPISGPFQMILGINNCVCCINGEQAFRGASSNKQNGGAQASGAIVEPSQAGGSGIRLQVWTGLNESVRGLCLAADLSRSASVVARIGEVVVSRTDRGNARWSAGLIRWARIIDVELRVGIQQLGPDVRPALVSPVSNPGSAENAFKPGIYVPGDADSRRQPSLVVPMGTYRVNRKMVVDDGTVTRIALAGKLLERSPYFDWFEFSLVRQPPEQPN